MSFNKDEKIVQPPTVTSKIFETIPAGQFYELQRRVIELEASLTAIKMFIYDQRKEWIAAGKSLEEEPVVQSVPILAEIQRIKL
ncbi:MAG: hypothetical protein Q8Q65_01480 [bacterium]|nr:hypothetical protein [bacterium]